MIPSKIELWSRYQEYCTEFPSVKMSLDLSRMNFGEGFFETVRPRLEKAFSEMAALESGAIANPDEKRMVGHYWLRAPHLAPTSEIRREIEQTVAAIKEFSGWVHSGKIQGQSGCFQNLLVIGIGGSALGPQFVSNALGNPKTDKMRIYFFDNTDPDGMDRVLAQLDGALGRTLCLVISKSGGTKETRNGMLEAEDAYKSANLAFSQHAVAITGANSELEKYAINNKWIKCFPMWDWVGGRTSELSAVGLLPACMQGIDIDSLIKGASDADVISRLASPKDNPSAQIAMAWLHAGNGKGKKDMVVLPYKDRLELFSKYLQQLIMESLGKEKDLDGSIVNQGISVFGNKGSTDQHSYIQQLRDGLNNFFVTFIQVLKDRDVVSIQVEADVTTGDYLNGFLLGTRRALYENGRESLTITIDSVTPYSVGVLIALFERAVGLYASLIGVNAYHQPGVEAGKKAAEKIIHIQRDILKLLISKPNTYMKADQIAVAIGVLDDAESVYKICQHLSASTGRKITCMAAGKPAEVAFAYSS